jgi:hypothetical protein
MRIKWSWVVVLVVVPIVIYTIITQARRVGFNQGFTPVQPINFSHKIHAGDNKVNCMYCHFAADKGRHAGVPPTELCLNCHTKIKTNSPEILKVKEAFTSGKNIKWEKVNHFPSFAYFNHSQHVRIGKVSCQECHGPVETMAKVRQEKALNMGWCLDCHREKQIAPPNDHKSRAGGDCARCHY